MKIPLFRIDISWDNEKEGFAVELKETVAASETLDTRDKVEVIDECIRGTLRDLRSDPNYKMEKMS